ncbi:MAG TPA: glycosyltransferase family 39 protein, partial [Anaerolineales bacterium]|nr:glycosyltransferase family 39 protein [Anaerolineales bacterium]
MMQRWRKLESSLGVVLNDGAKFMFMIFATVGLLLCLGYQLLAVPYRYSLDYGEAPLVDQAMRLAAGQPIYYADLSKPPYTISNYPPLYVTVLAGSVSILGPAQTFPVGRILSAFSTWIASLCLGLIIYSQTRDRFAAAVAALTFVAFPFVLYWSPLLRIDMLALALSLSALYILISEPYSPRRLFISAVLLVAAIYTRQSYALAAPLAGFVWLLTRDWRQALRLAAMVGGLTLALFFVLNGLTGGGFYFNIVTANVNEFKLDLLRFNWERLRDAALLPV